MVEGLSSLSSKMTYNNLFSLVTATFQYIVEAIVTLCIEEGFEFDGGNKISVIHSTPVTTFNSNPQESFYSFLWEQRLIKRLNNLSWCLVKWHTGPSWFEVNKGLRIAFWPNFSSFNLLHSSQWHNSTEHVTRFRNPERNSLRMKLLCHFFTFVVLRIFLS